MEHITTITLTIGGLLLILFLGFRGCLPPAPENIEQTESRRYQQHYTAQPTS